MSFEILIHKKLTEILDVWITYKVCYHTWVSNLSSARKKFGEIHLCIDFRNLNRSQNLKKLPRSIIRSMLHVVSEVVVSSSLKGLLEYHQVLVAELGRLILVYEKLATHTHCLQSLDGRVDNPPINGQDLKRYF